MQQVRYSLPSGNRSASPFLRTSLLGFVLVGGLVCFSSAEPPEGFEPPSTSERAAETVDSGARIPVNTLRNPPRLAGSWREALKAVESDEEDVDGGLDIAQWVSEAYRWGYSYLSKTNRELQDRASQPASNPRSEELPGDSASFAPLDPSSHGNGETEADSKSDKPKIDEPPRFTNRDRFDRSPKPRTLKSSDEDMAEYLSEENDLSKQSTIDRSLQGIDAERAQKPRSYGESRLGNGSSEAFHPSRATHFYGTPAQEKRLGRVQGCLTYYLDHPETTAARSPWAVMHALLPFGSDYEMIGPNGRVNAIGWMCHNGLCKTQRIFTPRGSGFVPNVGGGVQGHQGQFLAILAQSQVPPDYPIQIGDQQFTVQDLVLYEMATCREKSELTFKLIGLSYYVDSDKQWRANDGKVWSIQKLIQEELAQPIVGSACGGTHRLMGYSFAIKQRVLQGQPLQGQYLRAAKFVNEFIDYTWSLQNPDGSFSTNWYESRGNEPKIERKVQTTGHMLEWLMFTVSDSELRSARVERSIDFLLSHLDDNRDYKWPIGPRGHATRALALYYKRLSDLLSHPHDTDDSQEHRLTDQSTRPVPSSNPPTSVPSQVPRTSAAPRTLRPVRPQR